MLEYFLVDIEIYPLICILPTSAAEFFIEATAAEYQLYEYVDIVEGLCGRLLLQRAPLHLLNILNSPFPSRFSTPFLPLSLSLGGFFTSARRKERETKGLALY